MLLWSENCYYFQNSQQSLNYLVDSDDYSSKNTIKRSSSLSRIKKNVSSHTALTFSKMRYVFIKLFKKNPRFLIRW